MYDYIDDAGDNGYLFDIKKQTQLNRKKDFFVTKPVKLSDHKKSSHAHRSKTNPNPNLINLYIDDELAKGIKNALKFGIFKTKTEFARFAIKTTLEMLEKEGVI